MNILKILERQSIYFKNKLNSLLSEAKSKSDIYKAHSSVFKEFYSRAFKPLSEKQELHELNSEIMNDIMEKTTVDIDIAHFQLNNISKRISKSYNSNQDFKTKLKNKIQQLNNILSDIKLMIDETEQNTVVFKDSLSNYNFIDKEFSSGTLANISTAEGIATLAISDDENLSAYVVDVKVSGNGETGNYHTVKKVKVETENSNYDTYIKEKSLDNAKDDPKVIVDSNPSTWFEYQKLYAPIEYRKKYKLDWGTANKIKDNLTLKITIELDKVRDINLIDITPYIPEKSRSKVTLCSVKISEDGTVYKTIYENKEEVENAISTISSTNINTPLFNKKENIKLVSQGTLIFPVTKGKFIEVILKQTVPYRELLGTEYYKRTIESNDQVIKEEIIETDLVPKHILDGPPGKFKVE